jgi:Trk-type K+ transport system membrane component
VPVPPFLWIIVAVLGGVGFLIMLICYLRCIFSGCGGPSKCDWLLMGWYSPLVATFVALYLVHCCGGVWWLLILGFALAWLLAFLAWVKECHPTCNEVIGHLLGALGVVLIITGYLDSIPAIHACALSLSALIGIMVTTLGLVAAKYCS